MDFHIDSMPVLEYYSHMVPKNFFSDTNIIYINHIISDSLMAARAFKNCGAHIFTIGIPYGTTRSPTRKQLIRGFRELGPTFIPPEGHSASFSRKMHRITGAVLMRAARDCKRTKRKLLIVEDGGYAFPMLHDDPKKRFIFDYCIGATEHTARGLWNYQFSEQDGTPSTPRQLKRPAVTIASSNIKSKHEPPFVAQAIVDELSFLLRKKHEFTKYKTTAVIGYGKVGKSVALALKYSGSKIIVVEKDQKKLAEGKKSHPAFEFSKELTREILNKTDIIVSATGTPYFTAQNLKMFLEEKKESIFLASAASKQLEFTEIIELLEKSVRTPSIISELYKVPVTIHKKKIADFGIEYHINFNGQKKIIYLIADGYPVIFFPQDTNGAPDKAMDPVMTELFLAACLLKANTQHLENKVYTLSDLPAQKISAGPWTDLLDEEKILKKWCEFNNLNLKEYLKEIKFKED